VSRALRAGGRFVGEFGGYGCVEKIKRALLASLARRGIDGERLILDGRDVTATLSEPAIGELASQLSTLAVVRDRMGDLQRAAGADT